jgi:hypothetical protein
MIVTDFTPEEYELMNALQNPALIPVHNEDGEQVDAVDPRERVIKAHLGELLDGDDPALAVRLVHMAQEITMQNEARRKYLAGVAVKAKAGTQVARLLTELAEQYMLEKGIDEAEAVDFTLKIQGSTPFDRSVVVDSDAVPDEWWTEHHQRMIDEAAIDQHLRNGGDSIPGVEWVTTDSVKRMRINS